MRGMGIAYKDLRPGRYYKGTLDSGSKVFLFVESVVPSGTHVGVSACLYERRATGATWTKHSGNMLADGDSMMKREVTLADLTAENVPRAPLDVAKPSTVPPPPASTSGTAAVSTKPRALRKDGTPKESIPSNSRSTKCGHCGQPTRNVILFQFTGNWCPECEP